MKKYMGRNACLMTIGLFFSLLSLGGDVVTPLFQGWVITAIIEKDWDKCLRLATILFIINVAVGVFSGLQTYFFGWIANNIGKELRQDLFDEIMQKDVEFFDGRKTGDLISRMEADTQKVESGLSNQLA